MWALNVILYITYQFKLWCKIHPSATPGNQNLQRNDKFLLQRWKNLGVRRAKFKELWKFVEELSVVKRVTGISPTTPSKTENNNPNKVENNKFLFGTAAATSLNVKDSEKESKNSLPTSDLPPQVVVRNKKPINIIEGSGYEDVESNGVSWWNLFVNYWRTPPWTHLYFQV